MMSSFGASSSDQPPPAAPLVPVGDSSASSCGDPLPFVPLGVGGIQTHQVEQHQPLVPLATDGNDAKRRKIVHNMVPIRNDSDEQQQEEDEEVVDGVRDPMQGMPWPPKWWPERNLKSFKPKQLLEHSDALGKISTGISSLDRNLKGGVAIGSVTEVYGQAGCGKTQFCLQLIVDVLLEKKRNPEIFDKFAVYYIATEGYFPLPRIVEMLEQRPEIGSRDEIASLLQFLFIEKVQTPSELWHILANKLPIVARQYTMKLFIVDSIASVFRVLEDLHGGHSISVADRAMQMFRISAVLHRIASEYDSAVVCTNQVSAAIKNTNLMNGNAVKPALGLAWESCINARISLWRADRPETAVRKRFVPREEWSCVTTMRTIALRQPDMYCTPINPYHNKNDENQAPADNALVPTNSSTGKKEISRNWRIEFAPNAGPCRGNFVIESQGLVCKS